jgi:hypothetical protein
MVTDRTARGQYEVPMLQPALRLDPLPETLLMACIFSKIVILCMIQWTVYLWELGYKWEFFKASAHLLNVI